MHAVVHVVKKSLLLVIILLIIISSLPALALALELS